MCLLFLYVIAQPCQKLPKSSLKLVLASNRDEYYSRPTLPLSCWESNKDIIAGQDKQEGGTWLGISKAGKIAALLNITGATLPNDPANPRISRGFLTTDFLRSPPGLNGWTYCNNLNNDPDLAIHTKMNKFNLVTIDLLSHKETCTDTAVSSSSQKVKTETSENIDCPNVCYMTNVTENGPLKLFPTIQSGESQAFAFGNSIQDKPLVKVTSGCEQFENIINKYTQDEGCISGENKLKLKTDLLMFLKSTQQFMPDPQLEKQLSSTGPVLKSLLPQMCSRFVRIPGANYGTRTHSIIIVDSENNVEFFESTLQEPIDIENPLWKESKYEFTLSRHNNKM